MLKDGGREARGNGGLSRRERRRKSEAEPIGGSVNARPRIVVSIGTWGTSQAAGAVQGSDNNYPKHGRPIYVEQLAPTPVGNRQQRRLYKALVKASKRRGQP
jgi:hypothetical protein